MSGRETIGVLLMAYGSPATLDDVEAYYTHIRGGRKPSPETAEELKERYRCIGGRSPLFEITQAQARALERTLNAEIEGKRYRVYVGMKHWRPCIREAVERMAADGIEKAVGLALVPHYSKMSVGAYMQAAQDALDALKEYLLRMNFVESWHLQPLFIEAWGEHLRRELQQFPPDERGGLMVLFTAHSLPERIRQWDDPYPKQLLETCEAIALQVGLLRWRFAYQSASHTPEPWLGPDVLDILDELASQGTRAVLVCHIGFVADHLEVLYDIDVECRGRAERLGLHLERTESLNDDPTFIQALTAVVKENEP
jgi:ferrochelatase